MIEPSIICFFLFAAEKGKNEKENFTQKKRYKGTFWAKCRGARNEYT